MINKIKVFNLDKKKTYKLSLASMTLVLTLSGCTSKDITSTSSTVYSAPVVVESSIQEETQEEELTPNAEGINPLTDTTSVSDKYASIKINENEFNTFNNYLGTLNNTYDYAFLYDIDTSLKRNENYKIPTTYDIKINNITADELYDVVKENNKEYLRNQEVNKYQKLSNKELKKICNIVVDVINDQMSQCDYIDKTEMLAKLSDLKILSNDASFCNGYLSYDNCLIVCPNMIEIVGIIDDENDMDDIVVHETIHLIQRCSRKEYELNPGLDNRYGFGISYEDLDVSSLNYMWLVEASAERCMCTYQGRKLMTYENMVNYMESLSMINLVNTNYKVGDTEHLMYKDSIDDLYEYFGVTSEQDKREILNMMYSIEVLQKKPDDFYKAYSKYIGYDYDSKGVNELDYNIRLSSCRTFNKFFYRNLAKRATEENIPLNDIFYLISVYEMDLNNHISYDTGECAEVNKELMEEYVEIQNNFFTSIALSNNMSVEDIQDQYNSYTSLKENANGEVTNNYDLSWLGNDKVKYIDGRKEDLYYAITTSVRQSLDCYNEQNNIRR